jgi:hypothetical protein
MQIQTKRRTAAALWLVPGDGNEVENAERFERGFEAPAPTARPADRCEPWPVEDSSRLHALAAAAAACGVSTELAAILVVERALLASDLAAHGLNEVLPRLNAVARHASVAVELTEPLSAYLRALSGRTRTAAGSLPQALVLPMRLTERILARQGRPRLDEALLPLALAWERAAVLEGRTMSEWAVVKLLELGC